MNPDIQNHIHPEIKNRVQPILKFIERKTHIENHINFRDYNLRCTTRLGPSLNSPQAPTATSVQKQTCIRWEGISKVDEKEAILGQAHDAQA